MMVRANLVRTARIVSVDCSCVEVKGSIPMLTSLSLTSGIARIRAISDESLSTIALGVPAGASAPYQFLAENPGRPDSLNVGTAGNADKRVSPGMAIGFNLPLVMWGIALMGAAKYICT